MKRKKRILSLLVLCIMVVMQSCEKDYNLDQENKILKEDIISLANKYDLSIDVIKKDSKIEKSNMTLVELDSLFCQLSELNGKSFEIKLNKEEIANNTIVYSTEKRNDFYSPSIKTRSEAIYHLKTHAYNLANFNVTIIDKDGDIEIQSSISGVTMFTYTQNGCIHKVKYNLISFDIAGRLETTIGFENFGIHVSHNLVAIGSVSKSSGEGSVNVEYY